MKKLLVVLLVAALFVPGTVFAKAKKANVPEWAIESEHCAGDKDAANIRLGGEKIYVNEGMSQACFCKCGECKFKHDLYYSCFYCNKNKKTPGVCKCGAPLVPSFKHGDTWHTLNRDANGNMTIDGVSAQAPAPCAPEAPKKAKKSKKSKK